MPRTLVITPSLQALIDAQDGVASMSQLRQHGFNEDAVQHRVERRIWSRPAPGVVLTSTGQPTRRQLLVTASLWAGPDAVIDGADACAWYRLAPSWFRPGSVHVVVPETSPARSRGFVTVRRTVGEIAVGDRGL